MSSSPPLPLPPCSLGSLLLSQATSRLRLMTRHRRPHLTVIELPAPAHRQDEHLAHFLETAAGLADTVTVLTARQGGRTTQPLPLFLVVPRQVSDRHCLSSPTPWRR